MAGSIIRGPLGFDSEGGVCAPRTPGSLGSRDQSDPGSYADPGDSPGPVGTNDSGATLARTMSAPSSGAAVAASTATRLTPVQFADRYHNTRVRCLDPDTGLANSVVVDVHAYNNYDIPRRRANFSEKSLLVSRLRRELRRAAGGLISAHENHRIQIAKAFYGKASPEDFAVTLSHALRYGRATRGGLQAYCDNTAKLGLDCSGFVNQYFIHIGWVPGPRGMGITTYERRGQVRSSPEEIRDLDVLIWQGGRYRHIAVIDHIIPGSDPLRMLVVESSGSTGLDTNEYQITGQVGTSDVFLVDRGIGARRPSQVKFVQVNPAGT